jgi:hypothetical protein
MNYSTVVEYYFSWGNKIEATDDLYLVFIFYRSVYQCDQNFDPVTHGVALPLSSSGEPLTEILCRARWTFNDGSGQLCLLPKPGVAPGISLKIRLPRRGWLGEFLIA